jgi:pyrroloquinoline quinone biosynthesis protein B
MKNFVLCGLILFFCLNVCGQNQKLVVLGVAQDAGFPQIGAVKEFEAVEKSSNLKQRVVSLGIVDLKAKQKFLIEATPDLPAQLFALNRFLPNQNTLPDGIFLTHGHIGHYTGLMYLGREAIGANGVTIYAMPRMEKFLTDNAPWSQLVMLKNIKLQPISAESEIALNASLKIRPFLVPHRDEFTETVGFEITGEHKKVIFIPDIDKWSKWQKNLIEVVKGADYIFLDATFYRNGEIARDMSEVPHPFVEETVSLLKNLPAKERAKVYFIHFNHTNPLMRKNSAERSEVLRQGFKIADEGLILNL